MIRRLAPSVIVFSRREPDVGLTAALMAAACVVTIPACLAAGGLRYIVGFDVKCR